MTHVGEAQETEIDWYDDKVVESYYNGRIYYDHANPEMADQHKIYYI